MTRPIYLLGWSYVALCSWLVMRPRVADTLATPPVPAVRGQAPALPAPPSNAEAAAATSTPSAADWFREIKPFCNSLEVSSAIARSQPPETAEGAGYSAACLALAGRTDNARGVIDALPEGDRGRAASIVFDVGHPVADAGDDRSAGPMMEIVVDYVPGHYMALYHAGMAEYMLGQRELAKKNLEAFRAIYTTEDGWRSNAADVIRKIDTPAEKEEEVVRPRDP